MHLNSLSEKLPITRGKFKGFLIWEQNSAQTELHMMPLLPFRVKWGKEPHLILSFAQGVGA